MMHDALLALLFAVFVDQLSDVCTKLSLWMVKRAASQLPRRYRQRWHEDWCADLGTRSRLLRPIFALGLFRAALTLRREYFRIALVRRGTISKAPISGHAFAVIKRSLDIASALVIGAFYAPLILAIIARLSMERGPILFRHRRIGKGGKAFECLKFRTIRHNAGRVLPNLVESDPEVQAEWLHDHELPDDPRVTRFGRFLRKTRLDDLPKLWNVLRGEMSLVGPHPIVQDAAPLYGRHLSAYLATRPGLTGLWQLTRSDDTEYQRRALMDAYYAKKQSLLLDLKILLQTARIALWDERPR